MTLAYDTEMLRVALDGTDLRGQRVVIAGNKRLRALKQLAADHATSSDGQIAFHAWVNEQIAIKSKSQM